MQTKYCFKLISLTDIYFYHVTESETFISAEIIVNHYFLQQTTSALVHHHWTVDHRSLQEKTKFPTTAINTWWIHLALQFEITIKKDSLWYLR
jgi:hypothetical protein